MNPAILRHINREVCGDPIDGGFAGLNRLIAARMPEGGFTRGISVGCGVAAKEITLLSENIVERFDLFEVSEERIEIASRLARRHGVRDRIEFHAIDPFSAPIEAAYDLVYWNNALHHMFDAADAIAWSYNSLKPGGTFAMDDFVGAARFQWSPFELDIASRVRELLPERLLADPYRESGLLDRRLHRPDLDAFIAADPSEAADSDKILDGIRLVFPNAEIILTGGVVYHLALNDVLANFDDEQDAALLQSLLLLDATLASAGHSQYAVALAMKE